MREIPWAGFYVLRTEGVRRTWTMRCDAMLGADIDYAMVSCLIVFCTCPVVELLRSLCQGGSYLANVVDVSNCIDTRRCVIDGCAELQGIMEESSPVQLQLQVSSPWDDK